MNDGTHDPRDDQIRAALERQHRRIAAHIDARSGLDRIKEHSPMRRALVPALAAAAVVIGLIGAIALFDPFGGGGPVAGPNSTQPPTTTTTPGDTTTTTLPRETTTTDVPQSTTTTTEDITVGTLPPTSSTDSIFVVVGVEEGDVLNVRERPNPTSPVIAGLAPGAAVHTTGLATPDIPGPGWWQVRLEGDKEGWVNSTFVGLNTDALFLPETDFETRPCNDEGAEQSDGGGPSDVDHVLAMHLVESGSDCVRFVLLLGTGSGETWPETTAQGIPDGITISALGNVAAITLPASMGYLDVRPTATERDFGIAQAFVVRRHLTEGETFPGLDVLVHFEQNITVRAFFLPRPARIVLDVTPAPTGTGLDLAPVTGSLAVLEHRIQVDVNGPGVNQPIKVFGYARPFEAQGVAIVRTVGSAGPGSGELIAATYTDGEVTQTETTEYYFMTTDYSSTWGRFAFIIDGLAPGTYELFVGEFSAEDGSPVGVYDTFTVVG